MRRDLIRDARLTHLCDSNEEHHCQYKISDERHHEECVHCYRVICTCVRREKLKIRKMFNSRKIKRKYI